ncbi:siderophore biosynthesis protein [Micromonospora humidisoli]|uniref:LLM class flavin-dependent oxidoreductase n=1 Tax=Micromonospora humidisoli TaxID=2807622 RepID=A0ABS2JKG6_9ACTN|nr:MULTISPECIES: MupA/Atu3671 family FMN-dependent luciferase-like monooxygenase [Micromonospora]MBM7086874.1 LLM class flavin-dependent oxidoreductase [Micromonospora humidisoli]GHJ10358.1 siderophore biosynthesis protein [Micromonospora sp. AKA109]
MDLSLFFFSASDGDAHDLLLDSARFADRHGFTAVWTPERHFHEFGGPYPNPAVTGAAVAAVTRRVGVRAGSVVLPLHDPLRVAEEWAVVDRISHGRAGVAFASGWHAVDFVLAPDRYPHRRAALPELIDQVRALWRGGTTSRPDGAGGLVDVEAFPKPVQTDLPVWLTSAGDLATFELAGRLGVGVLTHLLTQSLDELRPKIARYRRLHPGRGQVTLMLHTLVGPDDPGVAALAREPMTRYLRSSLDLVAGMLPGSPFHDSTVTDDEADFLIGRVLDRFLIERGLFGSVPTCARTLRRLADAGVDEVACLVDFGVPAEATRSGLTHLARLVGR